MDESREGRVRLVLPELVLREAVNLWIAAVGRHDHDRYAAHRGLERAGIDAGTAPDPIDLGREWRAFDAAIREELADANALVSPLPAASHEPLIERALD